MSWLGESIRKFGGKKVAVIGDLVVDEYVFATPQRVSREAPVLIVSEDSRQIRLGSAGNVVANIRSLGGEPLPVGLVGDDPMGRTVVDMMIKRGIMHSGILIDTSRPTTTKTRVLAGDANTVRQQMLRIDRLSRKPVGAKARSGLVERLLWSLEEAEALVVSDYGEGVVAAEVFQKILHIIQSKPLPVFVDSRYHIGDYRGAQALIPNEPELRAATDLDIDTEKGVEQAGRWLLEKTGGKVVLVKRGCKGMALFRKDRPTEKVAAFGSEEVADRIGAGDTVLAVVSLALTSGMSPSEAMLVANTAGGITVTKSGTSVVRADELVKALEGIS